MTTKTAAVKPMTATKPRAYSYTRFSTPEQAAGDSARRQIELAERYAQRHGLLLDEALRLSDAGVSGFRGANVRKGALGQFLRAVDDGDVPQGSYLLVESLDRVSRQNPWDALPVFQQIINAGVVVVTLFDDKVYEVAEMRRNPLKILESLFVMVRANEESETKSRRGKATWVAKRRRAVELPLTARLPHWLRLEEGTGGEPRKIVLIPERATIVHRIVHLFLDGMGQHRIAETLNREGVPVFGHGAMWHRSYISKVLASPALVGTLVPREVVYEDGRRLRKALQAVEGYYPPVVTAEEWDSIKVMLATGQPIQRERTGRPQVQNILAGLAGCPLCGSAMTRVFKGSGPKGGNPKLVCTRAKVGAGCEYAALDLPALERAIREGLPRVLDQAPSGDTSIDIEVEALRFELENAETGLSNLIDELASRERSPALSAAIAEQEALKDELETKLEAAARRQDTASPSSQRRRVETLSTLLVADDLLDAAALNGRLRGVFSRVMPDWRDGKVRFRWIDGSEAEEGLMFAWPKGE
jgi:DNA invertase Pin-like site-specific DNA recombinase